MNIYFWRGAAARAEIQQFFSDRSHFLKVGGLDYIKFREDINVNVNVAPSSALPEFVLQLRCCFVAELELEHLDQRPNFTLFDHL